MMNTEILTFQETRRYLKISNSTLYRLVQARIIPSSKVGRSWRFKKSKIDAWLDAKEQRKRLSKNYLK